MIQLELFPETTDKRHAREIEILREKIEKLRKGQHARITGLQKEIKDLRSEIEFLKSNICKGLLC